MQIERLFRPRSILSAAAAAAILAGGWPALAGSRVEAKLAQPVAAPVEKIVDGRIWKCDGSLCVGATSLSTAQPLKRECQRAARELGAFVAYKSGGRELDEAGLKACNAK